MAAANARAAKGVKGEGADRLNAAKRRECAKNERTIKLIAFAISVIAVGSALASTIAAVLAAYGEWLEYKNEVLCGDGGDNDEDVIVESVDELLPNLGIEQDIEQGQ